jgi:uncharacterized protein DUF4440
VPCSSSSLDRNAIRFLPLLRGTGRLGSNFPAHGHLIRKNRSWPEAVAGLCWRPVPFRLTVDEEGRRWLVIAAFLVVLTAACGGDDPEPVAARSKSTADLIRETEAQRLHALVVRDMATARSLHADDFMLTTPRGEMYSKNRYLKAVELGRLDYVVFEPISHQGQGRGNDGDAPLSLEDWVRGQLRRHERTVRGRHVRAAKRSLADRSLDYLVSSMRR